MDLRLVQNAASTDAKFPWHLLKPTLPLEMVDKADLTVCRLSGSVVDWQTPPGDRTVRRQK